MGTPHLRQVLFTVSWELGGELYLPNVFVNMVEDFLQRLMLIFEASSQESLKGGSEKIEEFSISGNADGQKAAL